MKQPTEFGGFILKAAWAFLFISKETYKSVNINLSETDL